MKVLIVTSEAGGAKALKESFALSGFEVQVEESALYALTLLERNRPDILLSSEQLPEMSGAELYELVRADASLDMVPVLLLGTSRPASLGEIDRLLPPQTPIPEIVRTAYRLVLELTRRTVELSAEAQAVKGGIQGKLAEISLFELGQWLSRSAKTGRLTVQMGLEEGSWLFSKGQLIHAEYGERSGEDAVLSLLIQAEGQRRSPGEGGGYFVFEPLNEADFFLEPVTIRKTTDQLLLALAVEMDHQQRGGAHRA
jgi:CheY-like chemotaxis protein